MNNRLVRLALTLILALAGVAAPAQTAAPATASPAPGKYKNFAVAIYIPAAVVNHFADANALEAEWARISSQLKVDKVYIESHRDRVLVDEALLEKVKQFFVSKGVRIAGGITWTDAPLGFEYRSFCYTDPKDRDWVKHVSEVTARHFDEIILDDFFFVTTKLESDIAAKGKRSWTDFRLELMDGVARDLVVGAAKAANPKVKVVVKYPNWYEHFAGMGFDLAEEPKIFDGIYTGTETRDPNGTDQYLQQYESYQIIRYFNNIAPGRNGGGWVDTFSIKDVDRYAEQLWDTMLAKAPEMTLFFWGALLAPVEPGNRDAWRMLPTSFNYFDMLRYSPNGAPKGGPAMAPWEMMGLTKEPPTMARVAGYALDQIDGVVGHLGKPIGIKSYRPPHATGEDFLHNYLGLLGIPVELYPTFPEDANVLLLTEDAKGDPEIVAKIKKQLLAGKTVIITSGLAKALQGRGMEEIVEIETSERRFLADGYSIGFFGNREGLANSVTGAPSILFPQIGFLTNDAWAQVSAMSDGVGYPLLLSDRYGAKGQLYIWTIPDNFHNLYRIPTPVMSAIKDVVMKGFPVRLNGPSQVALIAYDNNTIVVQSFLATETMTKVGALGGATRLRDLVTGEIINGQAPAAPATRWLAPDEPRTWFNVSVQPHSYRAFAIEK
jgi:hypothetical protein